MEKYILILLIKSLNSIIKEKFKIKIKTNKGKEIIEQNKHKPGQGNKTKGGMKT